MNDKFFDGNVSCSILTYTFTKRLQLSFLIYTLFDNATINLWYYFLYMQYVKLLQFKLTS